MQHWGKLVVASILVCHAADSWAIRPNYLAYFGPQAGGADQGYKHLVDSSLDWGMDLPELRKWLDEHNPGKHEPLFLAYFGNDSPKYYGIEAHRLPNFFNRHKRPPYALAPGYYAISATLFQGLYVAAFGRWNESYEKFYRAKLRSVEKIERANTDPAFRVKLLRQKPPEFWDNEYQLYDHFRFARLCAWLRHQGAPPYQVGHSIFIWKLDYAALQAALLGPPVELEETPPEWRRIASQRE